MSFKVQSLTLSSGFVRRTGLTLEGGEISGATNLKAGSMVKLDRKRYATVNKTKFTTERSKQIKLFPVICHPFTIVNLILENNSGMIGLTDMAIVPKNSYLEKT